MSFLDTFLDWTKDSESPEAYFFWTALSAVTATMRDNLYQQWQYDRLYPNMFVILVGPPAVGKRMPMVKSGQLVKYVKNTKVIEGSASMQAVIKTLGEYETGGMKGASCLLYSEEFSSFHVKDQNTNELLTDLWDYHETWNRNLISWSASLKRVCVSLVAASNEILLKEVLDSRAMFGGLLSRTIVVVESKKRRKDALLRKGNPDFLAEPYEVKLKDHLMALSKLSGEIVFEEEAILEFELWYNTQWDEENPKTKTGIEGRMKTHVKKVAMALAMCEFELDKVVRKKHVEQAIVVCLRLYKNYQILAAEAGRSPTAHPAAILMRLLLLAPGFELTREMILSRNLGEFDTTILENTVLTLEGAGLITNMMADNKSTLKLTVKALQLYQTLDSAKGKTA